MLSFAPMRSSAKSVNVSPTEFRDSHAEINWRKLIGFRDFLAHNYEEIILEFVWAAVEDLPELRTVVRAAKDRLAGS
ncbi:MAG: DUF86 domain-containing protein [Anaerolineae bacterium]|nr:DUF86 domain-containing protein [Anaerolineae bacterium]